MEDQVLLICPWCKEAYLAPKIIFEFSGVYQQIHAESSCMKKAWVHVTKVRIVKIGKIKSKSVSEKQQTEENSN